MPGTKQNSVVLFGSSSLGRFTPRQTTLWQRTASSRFRRERSIRPERAPSLATPNLVGRRDSRQVDRGAPTIPPCVVLPRLYSNPFCCNTQTLSRCDVGCCTNHPSPAACSRVNAPTSRISSAGKCNLGPFHRGIPVQSVPRTPRRGSSSSYESKKGVCRRIFARWLSAGRWVRSQSACHCGRS